MYKKKKYSHKSVAKFFITLFFVTSSLQSLAITDNLYYSAKVGISSLENFSMNLGLGQKYTDFHTKKQLYYQIAGGFTFYKGFKTQISFHHALPRDSTNLLNSIQQHSTSISMMNLSIDIIHQIFIDKIYSFYGGGIGASRNTISNIELNVSGFLNKKHTGDSNISLSWKVFSGIGFQIDQNISTEIQVNYISYGIAKISTQYKNIETNQELTIEETPETYNSLSSLAVSYGMTYRL